MALLDRLDTRLRQYPAWRDAALYSMGFLALMAVLAGMLWVVGRITGGN